MASKPGKSHPDEELAKLSFDPGEVTATYPVGSLVKDLAQSKGHESQPPGIPGKVVAETVPVAEHRSITPIVPRQRRDEPNPALLLALSLGIGGGLALLLLLVVAVFLWVLT